VRKIVDDRPDRELALHMKCRLEFARRALAREKIVRRLVREFFRK
jgi:hypothetical protein